MATKGQTLLTWADLRAYMDPNGMIANVVEALTQTNEFLEDIMWYPSNMPLSHSTTHRTGLPSVYRRRLNRGTVSSKASVGKLEETLTMLQGFCTTDIKLLEVYGNANAARASEAQAFGESLAQTAASDYMYGTKATPEQFDGVITRYDSLTLDNGETDRQILSAGGSGNDLSSILLLGWGMNKIFGLYPKNTMAGIQRKDWGPQLINADDDLGGAKLGAYVDEFSWDYGLCVADRRYGVRICNIEPDDVVNVNNTQALNQYGTNIVMLMARSLHRLYNRNACQPRFYLPRAVMEGLDVQYLARTTDNAFSTVQIDGKEVMQYRGVPLRTMDALTNTEAEVT